MILLVIIFIIRLFILQVVDNDYKAWADSNAFLKKTLYPSRGMMYDMQAKLLPHTEEELTRMKKMGIDDPNKVLTLDDLVKGDDCIFSETAITDCALLKGVRYFGDGARTSTLVLRYKTGTVRFVDTIHRFGDKKPAVRLW